MNEWQPTFHVVPLDEEGWTWYHFRVLAERRGIVPLRKFVEHMCWWFLKGRQASGAPPDWRQGDRYAPLWFRQSPWGKRGRTDTST